MNVSRIFLAPLVGLFFACNGAAPPPSLPPPTTAQPAGAGSLAEPGAVSAPVPAAGEPKQEAPAPTPAAEGAPGNALTLAMLHALRGEKGNYFFSGASLRGALGMTALGAKGATLDELAKALAVDPDPAKNAAAAKAEGQAWKSAGGKAELA